MFIGEYKIKGVDKLDGDKIKVSFKGDKAPSEMNQTLYDIIATEEKGQGNIIDATRHFLSTKFLMELKEYGLSYYMIEHISEGVRTLAHNLREDLFRRTFNCTGGDDISLELLLEEYEKKEVKIEED